MMRKKKLVTITAAAMFALAMGITSFAGQWKKDNIGWWWQEDNGSYPVSQWKEVNNKWYYFYNSGYMAESTWIGNYYVGADGAWIEDRTPSAETSIDPNYYCNAINLRVEIRNDKIYYNLYSVENLCDVLYYANLDGSNPKAISAYISGAAIGPDNKIYYGYSEDGTLRRCNLDGSGVEILYQAEFVTNTYSGVGYFKNVSVKYANASGIQTSEGFYDIAAGQLTSDQNAASGSGTATKTVPSYVKNLIPNNNYAKVTIGYDNGNPGDYFIANTYTYNPYSFTSPYSLNGAYVIDSKNQTCVAYSASALGDLYSTDLGLFMVKSGTVYRIENGGNMVKLFDGAVRGIAVKNNKIYYQPSVKEIKIVEGIAPAALPTVSIY